MAVTSTRPPQEPTYHDPTVWTAPEDPYDYGWVPSNDNAGPYDYNENSDGFFYPQTVTPNMTGYQPESQLMLS